MNSQLHGLQVALQRCYALASAHRIRAWHPAAALAVAFTSPAFATHVTIHVQNVAGVDGTVRVALCRPSEWESHHCSYGVRAPATAGTVDLVIDVPPGVYGVLVHHDANGDDVINKNLIGIPIEGVGFSRNPLIRFGFPPFSAVSLPITGQATSATVSLLFEPLGAPVNDK